MNPEEINREDVAGFNVTLGSPNNVPEGFNEYGIRENYDGDDLESIDVLFSAMEPGIWKGVEITPEFLQDIANGSAEDAALQYDHSQSQRANVGSVVDSKFNDTLKLMVNIPNTGSTIRSDTIADFTHSTGPQITDGSVGFDPQSLEFAESEEEDAMAQFVDGNMIEFSLTPFPAGYEDGGVTTAFSNAVDNFVDSEDVESQLTVYESQLR